MITSTAAKCVSPAAVQEYERQSELTGICEILERRGLIRIVSEKPEGIA